MVKVENKETLRLLTKRFMKMNRARNIIAVIAIMLTSLLFTSLFVGSVSISDQTLRGIRSQRHEPCRRAQKTE